jgi:hypothetical protein
VVLVVTILCPPAATYEGEAVIQLVSATIHPIAVALAPPGSGLGIGRKLHFAPAATVRAVSISGTGHGGSGFKLQKSASMDVRNCCSSKLKLNSEFSTGST